MIVDGGGGCTNNANRVRVFDVRDFIGFDALWIGIRFDLNDPHLSLYHGKGCPTVRAHFHDHRFVPSWHDRGDLATLGDDAHKVGGTRCR
ncbi:hypothetical protein CFP56_018570 [Quercus suber]|uniref:Uncharacterized protein n=1 Tax=Quercus suber TaxID=58331 RepID=A0AAW0M0S8_QUESU